MHGTITNNYKKNHQTTCLFLLTWIISWHLVFLMLITFMCKITKMCWKVKTCSKWVVSWSLKISSRNNSILASKVKPRLLDNWNVFIKSLIFFKNICPCMNHEAFCPNLWTVIRLVAFHPFTKATCERSFRLNKLVKTSIHSAVTYKRMSQLCVFKHYGN